MKKIIAASAILMIALAGTAFAGELDALAGVDLSQGVDGTYFSNANDQTATHFIISTGHTQGNNVYGTSDFSTSVMRGAIAGDTFVSSDLITTAPTNWDSSAYPGDWSEM